MIWPRQGTSDKRPTAARLRLLFPLIAFGAFVAFGEPGAIIQALTPHAGAMASLPEYAGRVLPAYSPVSKTLFLSVAPFLAGIVMLALAAARYADRADVAARVINARPVDELVRGERGVSAIEFMLLLPLLLIIMLMILQVALIVQAKFIVNYAAFCAVRSAIVTIPGKVDIGGSPVEAKHQIKVSAASAPKMKMIRYAAALPCTAISPRVASLSNAVDLAKATGSAGLLSALDPRLQTSLLKCDLFALGPPPGVSATSLVSQFHLRTFYAYDGSNTKVEVLGGTKNGQLQTFGANAPVTVKVTFKYYLAVPFASRFLGKKFWNDGWVPGSFAQSGFYASIVEQYTLLNEGERTNRPQDVIE